MDKTGLGTASTRTNIIRTLLERKYIRYSGKYIIPTPKGLLLYETVRGMKVADASLTSGAGKRSWHGLNRENSHRKNFWMAYWKR